MDVYTTAFLCIVVFSIVAMKVPRIKIRFRLSRLISFEMDKEELTSSSRGQCTKGK